MHPFGPCAPRHGPDIANTRHGTPMYHCRCRCNSLWREPVSCRYQMSAAIVAFGKPTSRGTKEAAPRSGNVPAHTGPSFPLDSNLYCLVRAGTGGKRAAAPVRVRTCADFISMSAVLVMMSSPTEPSAQGIRYASSVVAWWPWPSADRIAILKAGPRGAKYSSRSCGLPPCYRSPARAPPA